MPNRPLVAIVDDDESYRRAMQSLLRSAGYATHQVRSPKLCGVGRS